MVVTDLSINKSAGITPNNMQNSQVEQNKLKPQNISIFTDRNNNGIVDKEDFTDSATLKLVQENGLIGKTWESVKDKINKFLSGSHVEPLGEAAQKEREANIAFLQKKGIDYKENADGSIEYDLNGEKIKDSYNGNSFTNETLYPDKSVSGFTIDFTTNELQESVVNADGNLRQELEFDSDNKLKSVKYYTKNSNGEFEQTDKFVGVSSKDRTFYTGSDIAKMFGDDGFNLASKDEAAKFFKSISPEYQFTNGFRDGSVEVTMTNGTVIKYEKPMLGLAEPRVIIEKDGIVTEMYNTKGEPIEADI